MFSHITLGVADVRAARRFYEPVLATLGLALKFADDEWAGWKHPRYEWPLFVLTLPYDGNLAAPGNGPMAAFLAPTRAHVDACHARALALGGRDEGAPGLRPEYHANYYGAYFRDPDGNKLCVCCHEAE